MNKEQLKNQERQDFIQRFLPDTEKATTAKQVERSDGSIDTGWHDNSIAYVGGRGSLVVEMFKPVEEGMLYKNVPIESFLELNPDMEARIPVIYGMTLEEMRIQAQQNEAAAANNPWDSLADFRRDEGLLPGGEQTPIETPEQRKYRERLERIFKFPEAKGRDRFGNNLDTRRQITADSEEAAAWAFRFTGDDAIKAMIREHAGDKWREREMPSVLREDDELRVKLGEYFLNKFDNPGADLRMPSRVLSNDTKNTSHAGYERDLTSREYASLLAISMLDGTFSPDRAKYDPIEIEFGEVLRGQHRYAASQLLDLRDFTHLNMARR